MDEMPHPQPEDAGAPEELTDEQVRQAAAAADHIKQVVEADEASLAAIVHRHVSYGHVIERPDRLGRLLILDASLTGAALDASVPMRLVQVAGEDEQIVVLEVPRSADNDETALAMLDERTMALRAIGAEKLRARDAASQIAAEHADERYGQDLMPLEDGRFEVPSIPAGQAQMAGKEWYQISDQLWRAILVHNSGSLTPAKLASYFTDLAGVRLHWQVVPDAGQAAPDAFSPFDSTRKRSNPVTGLAVHAACYLELWTTIEHDRAGLRERLVDVLSRKGLTKGRHVILPGEHAFAATRSSSSYLVPVAHVQAWPRVLVELGLDPPAPPTPPPTAAAPVSTPVEVEPW